MASERNDTLSVTHSFDEEQIDRNNQQNGSFIQIQADSHRIVRAIQLKKTISMTPTLLEYSCWWTYRTAISKCAIAILLGMEMTIGVLIVCFTSPKAGDQICHLNFIRTSSNPIEYNYGPRSVAIGDFNNDTWLDFVVANYLSNEIAVFLNDGENHFASSKPYSTGLHSTPYMVAVGDFNKDERLDIAVANFDANSIGVFLGRGNGTFADQIKSSTGLSRPRWISIVDLNQDDRLDITTADHGTSTVGILYGYGNGSFADPEQYFTGYDSDPFAVVAADFNHDDRLDLAVANHGTNNIGIFLANINGTFEEQMTFSTGLYSNPYSLVVGHFNDDNLIDVVVANHGTNSISLFLGYGNGSLATQTTFSLNGSSPYSMDIGDFNHDHQLDLIVTNNGTNNIAVLLGNGNGTFQRPTTYSTGSISSISVVVTDLNKDSRLDVIVISNDTASIEILFGIDEGFPYQTTYPTGNMPRFVTVEDFNNDERLDIAVANLNENSISILLGFGDGTFAEQTTYSTNVAPESIAFGDLNNDTHLDAVVACSDDRDVSVLLGYGNGSFAPQVVFFVQSYSKSVAVGDVNNDNRLDIIGAQFNDRNIYILLGYRNGSFAYPFTQNVGTISTHVAVGDFNEDHRLDVVVGSASESSISVVLGYGNGSFSKPVIYGIISPAYGIAVRDVNNDTFLDIIVTNERNRLVSVFLGHGNGSFAKQKTFVTSREPYSVAIGDFNNDTLLDIVVANFRGDNVSVLLGYGNGSFSNHKTYATGRGPHSVAVGYFNSDTRPDLVVANQDDHTISILLHYDSGALGNTMTIASGTGSRLQDVLICDINKDNNSDILVANYGTNNIGVLLGYGNGSFKTQQLFTYGSNTHPSSVTVGDFNKDSNLDILAANYGGQNIGMFLGDGKGIFTPQTNDGAPLSSTPMKVASGDFNGDGQSEILVIYDGSDNVDLFIAYDLGALRQQEIYSTGKGPRSIAQGDFNNDDQLDLVVANENDGSMSILFGYGNGSFAHEHRYAIGKFSDAVAVGDFNNDNQLDIVVAISSTDNSSTGIYIYFGYGNGSFRNPIVCSQKRFLSLAVGDLNNDTYADIVAVALYDELYIFFGSVNGSFRHQQVDFGLLRLESAALYDFNNDHRLDIALFTDPGTTICISLGHGNGSFSNPKKYSANRNAGSIVVGDFNNDQQLDILCFSDGVQYDPIYMYFGYGNGSFALTITQENYMRRGILGAADFNNDNYLDLLIRDYFDMIWMYFGNGDATFTEGPQYSVGRTPTSVLVADINKDNRQDVVVVNADSNNIGVLMGYVSQGMAYQTTLTTKSGSQPRSIVVHDFNNDSHMDVAIAYFASHSIGIFFGLNNYSFTPAVIYDTGTDSSPSSIAVGDFNKDNFTDIVVANYDNDNIGIFFGNINGLFSIQKTITTVPHLGPSSVVVGDFDNDGLHDIIVAFYGTNEIGVFVSHGDKTFADIIVISVDFGSQPFLVVASDFDNNNKLDFAVANEGKDNLQIYLQTC